MITVTLVEAQENLEKFLDTVHQQPVAIARNGEVAGILISPQEMPLLQEWQAARIQRQEAAARFEEFFTKTEAHIPPDEVPLGDRGNAALVGEVPGESRHSD